MRNIAPHHSGRHFLQIPGPTNVPDRVLQAIAMPTIDHRGRSFAPLGQEIVAAGSGLPDRGHCRRLPVIGHRGMGGRTHHTLSPRAGADVRDRHFATLWRQRATRLGLDIEFVPGIAARVDPAQVEEKLVADKATRSRRCASCTTRPRLGSKPDRRDPRGDDRTHHPALFMVDTISSLASIDYRHDAWKVDVTVAGRRRD